MKLSRDERRVKTNGLRHLLITNFAQSSLKNILFEWFSKWPPWNTLEELKLSVYIFWKNAAHSELLDFSSDFNTVRLLGVSVWWPLEKLHLCALASLQSRAGRHFAFHKAVLGLKFLPICWPVAFCFSLQAHAKLGCEGRTLTHWAIKEWSHHPRVSDESWTVINFLKRPEIQQAFCKHCVTWHCQYT